MDVFTFICEKIILIAAIASSLITIYDFLYNYFKKKSFFYIFS